MIRHAATDKKWYPERVLLQQKPKTYDIGFWDIEADRSCKGNKETRNQKSSKETATGGLKKDDLYHILAEQLA